MKLTNDIERLIKQNRFKATPETYNQTLQSFMQAVDEHYDQESSNMKANVWRTIMCKPITKLSVVAVVIVAVCASIPLFDHGSSAVYAIDQTIAAIQTIRTLHMRVTGDENGLEKNDYVEAWIKYDDTGRMTNFRLHVFRGIQEEGGDDPIYGVWNNGVEKMWKPDENNVFIHNKVEARLQGFLNRYDPKFMQQKLHDALQNKEQYDVTIDEPVHEDFIYVEVLDHINNTRLGLLVDPETKLVTHLDEYDLNEQGEELNMRVEFLAYNQPIDPELFELNEMPDDVRIRDKTHEPIGRKKVEANRQLAERVAQLDIDQADRAAVESLFGKPLKYVWSGQTFSEDQLRGNYILNYPCDFSVWMRDDRIMEIRFGRYSEYAYAPGVAIGASIPEVLAVLGDPVATVVGQDNEHRDRVLYRDIEGRPGHCYYHCSDRQIRLWFSSNKVCSIYMTRTDFPVY